MIKSSSSRALKPGTVDIWVSLSQLVSNLDLVEQYESLLNRSESQQYESLQHAGHKFDYLLSRVLLRTVLSEYADVEPALWCFDRNQYGKPKLDDSHGLHDLEFNISLTDGLVVCAVSASVDLGTDVEYHGHGRSMLDAADHYFSADEIRELTSLESPERRRAFYRYWTLKESLIKARGEGLSAPLHDFSFTLAGEEPRLLASPEGFIRSGEDWHFGFFEFSDQYTAAISSTGDIEQVNLFESVPLVAQVELENPDALFDERHRDALFDRFC